MRYSFSVTKRQLARLPLILRAVGVDHTQDPIMRPKGFPVWQIFYGVSGSGEFFAEGTHFILHPGQIALLPPHTRHGYHSLEGEWTLHYLGFDGPLCPRILAVLGLNEAGVYAPADAPRFLEHLHMLEKLAASRRLEQSRCSAELYAALLDLADGIRRLPAGRAIEGEGQAKEMVLYLEDHFTEDISLDMLSAQFRRTPEYLCSVFKAATGETILHYLRRVRIHQAKILLMEKPDAGVREISEACGFHSVSYFGRVFREATGFTPQGYRLGTARQEAQARPGESPRE